MVSFPINALLFKACVSIRLASSLSEVLWHLSHFCFVCLFCFVLLWYVFALARWFFVFRLPPPMLARSVVSFSLICSGVSFCPGCYLFVGCLVVFALFWNVFVFACSFFVFWLPPPVCSDASFGLILFRYFFLPWPLLICWLLACSFFVSWV